MLEFKDNPRELMQALDRFLSVYFGDRQVENKLDIDEIKTWNIPQPLKYLYSFVGKYPGKHGFLGTQDYLHINSGKGKTYAGKIVILSENEGCWSCYTETEGEDPPVWTQEYGGQENSPKWKLVNNSLSQFLVTFCLIEAYMASYHHSVKYFNSYAKTEMLAEINKIGYDAYLLWQGDHATNIIYQNDICYPDICYPNCFYSIEDAILILGSWGCATNYKNADRLLTSI